MENKKRITTFTIIIERNPRRYLGILKESLLLDELSKCTSLDTTSMYLTFKKNRLDQTLAKLADDFGISESTASRIFLKVVMFLSGILPDWITWPPSDKIKKLFSLSFREQLLIVWK